MGWFWFIPAFHIPPPPFLSAPEIGIKQASTVSTGQAAAGTSPSSITAHFKLTKKDVDFAIGAGSAIIDIDVEMEWATPLAISDSHELSVDQRETTAGNSAPKVKAFTNQGPPERKQMSGDSISDGKSSLVTGLSALINGARLRDAKDAEDAGKQ